MKKIILTFIATLLAGVNTAWAQNVAKIGTTEYATLAAAINAVSDGGTITMIANVDGAPGMTVPSGKNFTVDFNGTTYTLNKPGAGSTNTETLGFQLLTGSTITFKNGTINISEENLTPAVAPAKNIKRIIQNYANLTLEDMTIDGTNQYGDKTLVVSLNNGTCAITGNTSIIAGTDPVDPIMDVSQWSSYDGPVVTINTTGTIGGNIDINVKANKSTSLTVQNGNVQGTIVNSTSTFDVPVSVSGGTFKEALPENYLAAGFLPAMNANGTYSVIDEDDIVAKIGDTPYASLEDAFAAVQDGETITLLKNVTLTERLFVNAGDIPAYDSANKRYATTTDNKSITLDLYDHNITSSSNIALAGGTLNIVNTATEGGATIKTTAAGLAPVEIYGKGDLTQKRTLTVGDGVILSGPEYGLNIFGSNNANKNIIDVTVDGSIEGILFVLGNLSNAENDINIVVNGEVDASNAATGNKPKTGIALNGNAKLTVNEGAKVTGETGIEVRAGKLIVNGGNITATADAYSYQGTGSGTTSKGAAIAVAKHNTPCNIEVSINGGELVGPELIAVYDALGNGLEGVSVTASEGFVTGTETKLPTDYAWKSNGDGTYSVGLDAEAQIVSGSDTTPYLTLAEAFAAVEDDETIELLKNVTLSSDIECPLTSGKIYFMFNGFTVDKGNDNYHVILPKANGARALVPSTATGAGAIIYTDEITDIFAAAEGSTILTGPSDDPNYSYFYQAVADDEENAIARNKQTGILFDDLQTAVDLAQAGQTIELLPAIEGVTIENTVTINKNITIDGQGDEGDNLQVTSNAKVAFEVTGPGSVTFNKVDINAQYYDATGAENGQKSGSRAIKVDQQFSDSLVINYSTIMSTGRGIDVYDVNGGFVLDVKHSNIEAILQDGDEATAGYINSFDYDPDGRARGINFSHKAASIVANIQFSKIQGYAYPVHVWNESGKVELNMTDCSTWGRNIINNEGDNSTFNLKNVTSHSYNNESSDKNEAFAAIVDYKTADLNIYNIEDLKVVAVVKAADIDPTSATQNFIDLRGTNATVKITGNSGYVTSDTDTNLSKEIRDRVGFVNKLITETDVIVGEYDAYKRMIDKTVNNRIYFDDESKSYFNFWFEIMEPFEYDYDNDTKDELIRIAIADKTDYTNLYPVVPLEVKVKLTAWVDDVLADFYFGSLEDAFNSDLFGFEATIQLLAKVDLNKDINVRLERGEAFTLILDPYDVTVNKVLNEDDEEVDASIKLPPLVTAYSDDAQAKDLFTSADETLAVIKGANNGVSGRVTYYVPANVYYADTYEKATGDPTVEDPEDPDYYQGNIDGGLLWIFKDLLSTDADAMRQITPDCYVRLEADVTLDETYTLPIGGDVDNEEVFYLDLNGKTIEGEYKSLVMRLGTAIYTTGTIDIFSSIDPEYTVVYDVLDTPIETTYTDFEGNSKTVSFTHKYYLVKDGLAVIVDPSTYCGDRLTPNFIVKKKVVDADTGEESWVVLEDETDYTWSLVPPASDDADDKTYIDAKTYVQAIVIEGITFQGTRKADFTILPRDIKDVTATGNEQPWTDNGYAPMSDEEEGIVGIEDLIQLQYFCKNHGDAANPILQKYVEEIDEITGELLKSGDYIISVEDGPETDPAGYYKEIDTYSKVITITAVEGGNYTGTLKLDFTILPEGLIDISKCVVTSKAVYTSQSQKPSYNTIEVVYKNGYDKIVLDPEQFNITVHGMQSGYIDAQTYSNAMTLTGTKKEGTTNTLKFYGSVIADYTIAQRDLADSIYTDDEVEVVLEKHKDMEWTGEDLTNEIKIGDIAGANNLYLYMKVKDNGYRYVLTNVDNTGKYGFDYSYTVEPSPMIDPGEYKVIFTGRGNFCGMREIKINVLKDINLIADGIEVPLQVIPNNVSLAPSELKDIVVKDGDKVLEQGVHYEIIVKDETGNTTFTEESPILINGMYQAIFKGLEPYYFKNNAQEMPVVFEYNHFDTSMDNTEYYNNSTSGYQIVKPVSIHVTSGKNMECQVGDKPGSTAVKASSITSTLPGKAEFLLGSANKSFTFKVVGIDDKAFNGCTQLHWVDALALEGYTPSTLTREVSEDGPFSGYPVQSLVYLDGCSDVTGTNYIYKKGENDFRCEELKIYDDIKGDQQGFETDADYIGGGHAWEFMNKYEFTADKVTNTRVFTAGQHYTTCLPYKLQMNSALKAYTLDAASDNIFGFKQYTAKELDQFTPYVLIPSKGGNLLNNAESTVVYVTPTVNRGFMPLDENNNRQYLATPTGHIMYGSTIYMGWSSTYPITFDLYIMQSKNMWKKIPTARQSTYNKACVLPMRAYIMLPSHPQINGAVELDPAELIDNPSPSPSRELMPAKYIDTVDGIDAIETVEDWTDAEVYDLQGRKVDTTARLPKGVYIVNGQKRIRK